MGKGIEVVCKPSEIVFFCLHEASSRVVFLLPVHPGFVSGGVRTRVGLGIVKAIITLVLFCSFFFCLVGRPWYMFFKRR